MLVTGSTTGIGKACAHAFAAVDLRADGACEGLIGDTVARLGGLNVMVNNAGVLYTANVPDTSDEQWLDTWPSM